MTDLPPRSPLPEPPGDEADLLASLYLDDEATAEERAIVEADPALMAKVEQFRTIAAENANVAVPAGLADRQIAAALEAFDALATDSVDPSAIDAGDLPPTRPVTSLAAHRARRSRVPTWLGAAAVSALVIGGLGVVASRGSGGDDEVASIETSVASSSADAATDSSGDVNGAAAAEADLDDGADRAEGAAVSELEAEALAGDEMADELAEDDTAAESTGEEGAEGGAGPDISPEEAATFYLENGPVDLADYEGTIAADYFVQLQDLPLQPIEVSPCADSPLVAGLFDSFVPVIYERQESSLVVQAGSVTTALIIGPNCEIVLS